MTNREMFPICSLQISNPKLVSSPDEFWALIPPGQRKGRAREIMLHLRDYSNHPRCYAVALIWSDEKWCVVYDDQVSHFSIPPGMIQEAYRAASRGEHFLPYEQRARPTFSSGRTGH